MSYIEALIEKLPEIILYIVVGYTFVKTFHFVALKKNSTDIEHILISSLVIGYIYCKIAYLIPISISYEIDTALIILSALVIGYISGRIIRCKYTMKVLDLLKIRDTGNLFLWDDMMDNDNPMKVIISYDNIIYEGLLHNYESYSNEPHIALGAYIMKNKDSKIISDFSNDNTRVIILDTSNATSVDIIYSEYSEQCKDLQDLCNSNNEIFKNDFKEQEN